MVFILDIEQGLELNRVDYLSAQLDRGAVAVKQLKEITRVKITNLRNTLQPIYQEILDELCMMERSYPDKAVPLKPKSFEVFGRWQLLARCLGQLSATSYYNDHTFRVLLDQLDSLALKYKASTPIQIVKDFLEESSFSNKPEVDTSILAQYASSPVVSFEQIIGMDSIKQEIRFILKKIKAQWTTGSSYNRLLLYGPPGTGKTLFAEAIAKELDYLFIRLGTAELSDQYVGQAEKRLSSILRAASADQNFNGVFILFDEIDSFTGRGADVTSAQKSITTTMLQEINNSLSNHVFLCATTNFPRKVDNALLRRFLPGVAVKLPDEESIRKFLEQRSIFGKIILNTFPPIVNSMYNARFSQDNITQFLAILLDRLADWGTQPNQKYSTMGEGLSFTMLYQNKLESSAIYYRNDGGTLLNSGAISDSLPMFGIPHQPASAPEIYDKLGDLMRHVKEMIITSSVENIEAATLPLL